MKMALFPAYSNKPTNEPNDEKLPWLQNESCPDIPAEKDAKENYWGKTEDNLKEELQVISSSAEESNSSKPISLTKPTKKVKKKKKKHKKYQLKDKILQKHKKKSDHKKRKRSDYESDSGSDYSNSKYQEKKSNSFATVDGRHKDILFHGDFRSLTNEDVIYFDRLPDKNNSIFSNTHYTQVCSYKKLYRLPLGMNLSSKKKKLNKFRYFTKSFHVPLDPTPVVKLIKQELINFDYIPLKLTYSEEQKSTENKTKDNTSTRDYSDVEIKSDTDIYSEKDYWQNVNKKLNENLSKEPHNVSLWLKFIDIQDKVMAYCFDGADHKGSKGIAKNLKIVVERKISVLDSAINKNSKALDLHIKKLHLGEIVWEKKKLESEWDKLVHTFPNKMEVWHNYLSFHQTYFSTFHLDHIVKAFSKCSKRLSLMQREVFLSHKPPENLVYDLMDITTQLAFVWYQGGFMERAVALFQALFELNFYSPEKLIKENVDFEAKLDIFEAFWDSKAPRFGEKNSIGWAKFMEKKEPVIFPEKILEGTHDEEDEILLKGGKKQDLWVEIEFSREHSHWMPWQDDPDECEDLERMVSFNVIKNYLFILEKEIEKFYLALNFLNFLGVSIPSSVIEEDLFPWREFDHIFYPSRLEALECLVQSDNEFTKNFGQFSFPVIGPSVVKVESETYFEFVSHLILRFMTLFSIPIRIKLAILYINLLTKRSLAIRMKHKDEDSWRTTIKNYKKRIKNLLKDNNFRSDPGIYYEFAKFEAHLSSKEDASKVHLMILKTLLANSSTIPDIFGEHDHSFNIWRHLVSFVRLQLEKESFDEKTGNIIFNLVCELILDKKFAYSESSPNASQILRLRHKLETYIDLNLTHLINKSIFNCFVLKNCISIYTMILLLLEGVDFIYTLFEKYIDRLKSKEFLEEELLQNKPLRILVESLHEDYLWTINLSKSRSHFKCSHFLSQSRVKQILKFAMESSPNNIFFLETLAKNQNWRDMLFGSDVMGNKRNRILVTIFRIVPHIKKVVSLISSAEFGDVSAGLQLKSLLESAVSSDIGRNCPLLWRIYMRLMFVMKREKDLLNIAYRAIHSCPFAKCLYLDCIRLLPEKMDEMLRMMNEKGIRIRLPVEELDLLLEEEKEDLDEANNGIS